MDDIKRYLIKSVAIVVGIILLIVGILYGIAPLAYNSIKYEHDTQTKDARELIKIMLNNQTNITALEKLDLIKKSCDTYVNVWNQECYKELSKEFIVNSTR